MIETWKDIRGYEGTHQASNLGKIKTKKRTVKSCYNSTQIRKSVVLAEDKTNNSGYIQVCIAVNGKKITKSVHRLVMLAFKPQDNEKLIVNHIDGNKHNNNLNNLEWCTHKENDEHSLRLGLKPIGEQSGMSKLTDMQVYTIREMILMGCKQKDVAKMFKIAETNVSAIKHNKTWKHIPQL